jgi:hypothetical protein
VLRCGVDESLSCTESRDAKADEAGRVTLRRSLQCAKKSPGNASVPDVREETSLRVKSIR